MADIARLGIEVRSDQAERGAKNLDGLTNAAKRAEGATGLLKNAFDRIDTALKRIEGAVNAVERAVLGMGTGLSGAERAVIGLGASSGRASGQFQQLSVAGANVSVTFGKIDAAADMAAAAIQKEASATDLATANAREHVAALNQQAAAARGGAQAMNIHTRAANDNVFRMGGSMSGLAAQFQDIGVTAAMGMNPLIIALQQGTQIAGQMEAAMQGGSSALDVLGQSFKSLFSPLTFVTIALTALTAAGLQMVDWPKSAAWAMDLLADNLEMIAPYAVAAAGAIALIYAPSIVTGLVHLIALIARVGTAALGAAGSFTTAWLAAMGPIGWLIAGIGSVAAAAFLLRDQIKTAIGVDVVAVFKAAGNFIINSFEAAYADVKFIWSNFGDMMGAAVIGGVNVAIRAINGLIEQAAKGIDKLIDTINPVLEYGGLEPFGKVGGSVSIKELDNPYADSFSRANAAHAGEIERIMGQDRLGQFGAAIGEGASAASGKLRELADWMTTVDEKGSKKRGKSDADHYQDIVDGADRQIAALLAEQAALGMTEEAAAALRYEQDLLNDAQQRGIELTPQQAGYFKMLAGTMAGLEAGIRKAQEAMAFAKDITRGFIDDFRNGLEQGKGFWESFGNAALGVLDRITDKLLNDVLDALFQVNSAGSGGGGIFGTIVGGIGKLLGFANGGYTGAGGKYEPAGVVHRGEYVFSAAATRALGVTNLDRMHKRAKGYAEGGYVAPVSPRMQSPANANGAQNVHVTVGVSVDRDGNLQAYVKDVAQQEAGQAGVTMLENYRRFGVKDDIEAFQQDPRRFG